MSNQRRTRFSVTLLHPGAVERKEVILGYTARGIIDHYNRRGIAVVHIQKGDYRKAAKRPTGAKVSASALKSAIEALSLKLPVEIHYSNRQGGARGYHSARPYGGRCVNKGGRIQGIDTATGFKHCIMLKSYLDADQMGKTLWHELCHAMQFERDVPAPLRLTSPRAAHLRWCGLCRDGTTYSRKPYEIEARSYEGRNHGLPLAR